MKLSLSLIGGIIILLGLMIWGIVSPKIRYLSDSNIIVNKKEWLAMDSISKLEPDTIVIHDTIIIIKPEYITSDPEIVYIDTTTKETIVKYRDTLETEYFKVNIFDSIVNSIIKDRQWNYEVTIPTETITIEKPIPTPYEVEVKTLVGGFFIGADAGYVPYNGDAYLLGMGHIVTKKGSMINFGAGISTGTKLAIQVGYAKKIF